jgi:hypothetical protein
MVHSIIINKITINKLLIVLGAFLLPIKPLLILVGLCIFLDTIFGVWKCKKTGVEVNSKGLSAIISKMVLYQSAIILFFALEKYILGDFVMLFTSIHLFITKIIAILLIGIEVTSISENIKAVTGRGLWGRIRALLGRAKAIKSDIKEITKDIKEVKHEIEELVS